MAHSPSLGSSMGKQGRKDHSGETPPSTSLSWPLQLTPNLHCGCEMTIPLCGCSCETGDYACLLPLGRAQTLLKPQRFMFLVFYLLCDSGQVLNLSEAYFPPL